MVELTDLLNQFEAIGGPEEFGPEGIAILVAVWRKSSKLGWRTSFQMTNTEILLQTGFKSRDTLNKHRSKLVDAGLMDYTPPPRGSAKGEYVVYLDLISAQNRNEVIEEPVRKMDHSGIEPSKVVQNPDHFGSESSEWSEIRTTSAEKPDKVVQNPDTVLKDTTSITTTTMTPEQAFEEVMTAYCQIHKKLDIHVKPLDVMHMQEVIALGVPSPLITRVMRLLHQERTAKGARITSFAYYKTAILDAWELEKAITDGVPIPTGLPAPTVALGSPKRTKQQQQQFDELDQLIAEEEAKQRGTR